MVDQPGKPSLEQFKKFSPMNGLRQDSLNQIYRRVETRSLQRGKLLFSAGDNLADSIYLLSGTVGLIDETGKPLRKLEGGSPDALHRLAHQVPRKVTAKCLTDVSYFTVDSNLLDVMLTWDQTGSFEVEELDSSQSDEAGEDWMTHLLQMKAFQRVPPANLQAMFMRMQQIDVKPGETIIKQGDEGDFFFVLIKGRCLVTRETPTSPKPIKLAELGPGSCFGEEALISSAQRNATIQMLESGSLMRLSKQDFQDLLKAPLSRTKSLEDAKAMVDGGQAKWLDVRLPSEFKNNRLPGAVNLPLYMLRPKLSALPKDQTYIICCDGGNRSSVAAFVLTQKGYEAFILDGGVPPLDS